MPEINNDKENAIRILEYWFTMEFLNQQKLNDIKNKGKAADKYIKEYKSGRSQEKKKYLENFVELESGDNLQKMVDITKEETQLPLCSGFTVFIGCMKKEICINRIAQNVKWKGQRPEENDDEIALASISFSKNGDYITNSLSISPLAWAVKRLSGGTDNAYLKLSHQNYHDEAISIEEKIKGLLGLVEDDSSASESNVSFSENSLSVFVHEFMFVSIQILSSLGSVFSGQFFRHFPLYLYLYISSLLQSSVHFLSSSI